MLLWKMILAAAALKGRKVPNLHSFKLLVLPECQCTGIVRSDVEPHVFDTFLSEPVEEQTGKCFPVPPTAKRRGNVEIANFSLCFPHEVFYQFSLREANCGFVEFGHHKNLDSPSFQNSSSKRLSRTHGSSAEGL